jgi:hypothetical protein
MNSGLRTGKTGGRGIAHLMYVRSRDRPSGDFCPRPFRCALPAFQLWGPVCSSSTPGPYCPEGNLWAEPPRPHGFVGHGTEGRRSSPAFERLRSIPGRKDEWDYAGGSWGCGKKVAKIFFRAATIRSPVVGDGEATICSCTNYLRKRQRFKEINKFNNDLCHSRVI